MNSDQCLGAPMNRLRHIEPLVRLSGDQILFRADLKIPRLDAATLVSRRNGADKNRAATRLLRPLDKDDSFQK